MPSSWRYGLDYMAEKKTISGSLFFMGRLYHNLPSYWLAGTPPWFYAVFYGVKFDPVTVTFALVGLGIALWRRRPADRVLLTWILWWLLILSASGSKWGRFTLSLTPAFLLCAALRRWSRSACRPWPDTGEECWPDSWAGRDARAGRWRLARRPRAPRGCRALSTLPPVRERSRRRRCCGTSELVLPLWHCDYFDAGLREALAHLAKSAPRAGSRDRVRGRTGLSASISIASEARRSRGHPPASGDYACKRAEGLLSSVVQTGHASISRTRPRSREPRRPGSVVRQEPVNGRPTVRVYRLAPGEHPISRAVLDVGLPPRMTTPDKDEVPVPLTLGPTAALVAADEVAPPKPAQLRNALLRTLLVVGLLTGLFFFARSINLGLAVLDLGGARVRPTSPGCWPQPVALNFGNAFCKGGVLVGDGLARGTPVPIIPAFLSRSASPRRWLRCSPQPAPETPFASGNSSGCSMSRCRSRWS